ncbi:MAG: ABC transporter substrate-binding protein [Nocardioides sp.]|nr:ABC transporter substrate-binding protein [Nocardioides sp.]
MKSRRSIGARLAGCAVVGALVLSACGSSEDAEQSGNDTSSDGGDLSTAEIYATGLVNVDEDAGEPTQGGTLTIAEYSEARTLDPAKTYANGAAGGSALAAVYDTLMRFDHESDSFEPQMAESLESDDDTTWTLTLREDVTFTDGTPLDAETVVASINRYTENYAYQSLTLLANLADMSATDERTVTFTLRSPWTTFPNILAGGTGMIVAPAAYADPESFEPIGAGPFTFGNYAPGEELTLEANPDYWDGAPYLEQLRFVWLGSDEAKLDSLDSGGVDAAFVRGAQPVEKARRDGWSGMMFGTGLGANLWVNNREGRPGEDVRVRRAMDMAIDPETYLARVADGAGEPTKALFPESAPWHTGVEPNEYDTEAARALLEEAKADGYDGQVSYVHAADPVSTAGAVAIEGMLEAAGFEVTLEPLRNIADQIQKIYIEFDYDLAMAATSIPEEDPFIRLVGMLNSQAPENPTAYANPDMDAALAELQAASGPEDGAEAMTKIEELWHEEVPGIGFFGGGTFQPWQDNVHGVVPTTETMFLYGKAWKS